MKNETLMMQYYLENYDEVKKIFKVEDFEEEDYKTMVHCFNEAAGNWVIFARELKKVDQSYLLHKSVLLANDQAFKEIYVERFKKTRNFERS